MSYKIKEEIIHDHEAMWFLGLMLKQRYEAIKEQILEASKVGYIIVEGEYYAKRNNKYSTELRKLKTELGYLNNILERGILSDISGLDKYIKIE